MKSIVSTLALIRSAASKFSMLRSTSSFGLPQSAHKSTLAVLALLVGGTALSSSPASAAIVTLYASVPGYGKVVVLKGSNTGGRVVRHAAGYLYTDRVARGELLTIEATANSRVGECDGDFCVIDYDKKDDPTIDFFFTKEGVLPLKHTFRIPMDPGFSKMFTYAETCNEWSRDVDIPIGSR